ncbi:hypothetical protein RI129_009123 [Pyrocoelia pectoralis]|uniref:Mutator-like transposase domain-containing protein n=1 Tax=Pyrocoelia pectoralis TaxID=417401 RepID=A0AAN7VCD7_9COLE
MTSKYFRKMEHLVGQEWEKVLEQQISQAGAEEKQLALDAGNVEEDIPFVTVIVDGGWAKRSYAVIIGKNTGKLLFLGIRNKYCSICASQKHSVIKKHVCFKNFSGPPTGMEQDIIVDGFNSSVAQHGVRYKYVIGDGDSSVYARIIELVSYGRFVIKLECANHITRCYTSQLHKITTKTSHEVETRRILKQYIPRLSVAVRSAISNNTKSGSNAQQLREDLKNGPYHVFGYHANSHGILQAKKH